MIAVCFPLEVPTAAAIEAEVNPILDLLDDAIAAGYVGLGDLDQQALLQIQATLGKLAVLAVNLAPVIEHARGAGASLEHFVLLDGAVEAQL